MCCILHTYNFWRNARPTKTPLDETYIGRKVHSTKGLFNEVWFQRNGFDKIFFYKMLFDEKTCYSLPSYISWNNNIHKTLYANLQFQFSVDHLELSVNVFFSFFCSRPLRNISKSCGPRFREDDTEVADQLSHADRALNPPVLKRSAAVQAFLAQRLPQPAHTWLHATERGHSFDHLHSNYLVKTGYTWTEHQNVMIHHFLVLERNFCVFHESLCKMLLVLNKFFCTSFLTVFYLCLKKYWGTFNSTQFVRKVD